MNEEKITPIPIHVASAEPGVLTGQPVNNKRFKTTYETYVLTAADPVQNILPQDPKRYRYSIFSVDNDIVLGPSKGVTGNAVNTVAGVPAPNGGYFPKGLWRDFHDNGMVYAGATTIATISRVVVIAEYYE
jgi:hypothetical protein